MSRGGWRNLGNLQETYLEFETLHFALMSTEINSLPGLEERSFTQQDREAVQALLRKIREDERTRALSAAVVAWLATYAAGTAQPAR